MLPKYPGLNSSKQNFLNEPSDSELTGIYSEMALT